jgi:hypothetical protein
MFDASPTTHNGIVMLIWTQLRLYFVIGWDGYKQKIRAGKLSKAKAWSLFTQDYGNEDYLFTLEADLIYVPYIPFGVV